MIPVLCNPVATQPYMNLPLKNNSVNDVSINSLSVTNNGAFTSTGIFGETDGAFEFAATGDYLAMASSVGNQIATFLNGECTICWFNYTNVLSQNRVIIRQYALAGQRSFFVNNTGVGNALSFGKDTGSSTSFVTSANNTTDSVWEFLSVSTSGTNGINIEFNNNGTYDTTTLSLTAKTNSTTAVSIGGRNDASDSSLNGKLTTLRVYNGKLSRGEIAVLNQQMGRVA